MIKDFILLLLTISRFFYHLTGKICCVLLKLLNPVCCKEMVLALVTIEEPAT